MTEEQLNIKYIKEKTGLLENDELISIILEMINDCYRKGLEQSRFDKNMLERENQELKKQLSNDYQIKMKQLQQENRKLKQQLSNSHQIKNQQKEFIEYLENEIKRLENIEFYIESMQKVAIATHKHNLSKYREIIDGKEYCVEKDENANQINVSHNCKYINLLNEYQNWLAKEKEVVYRDCGHTQKAITKCYDKLVYLRKIYKDDYDIG